MEWKFGLYLLLSFVIFTGCDSVVRVLYGVKNKTKKNIRVHVPNYQADFNNKYSAQIDTIIELKPKELLWVRISPSQIIVPWAVKSIYKKNPGICGLELIENDTVIALGCSRDHWKYKRRCSILKIRTRKPDKKRK